MPLDDIVFVFLDADGDGPQPLALGSRLLHGPTFDQVFADENSSGEVLWSLTDNQGTVRDVAQYNSGTDTTSIVNHRKYDSFGRITSETNPGGGSPAAFLYSYTGREWDADAGLFYYRMRWYDPNVGRFISEDPLSFVPGDTNVNRYVQNSPTQFEDPSGLQIRGPGGRNLEVYDPPPPRQHQPPLTPDERRVMEMAHGDPTLQQALATLMTQIRATPPAGGVLATNSCNVWMRSFMTMHYPNYAPRDPAKVTLADGKIILEPLSVGTVNGARIDTYRSLLGIRVRSMRGHAFTRVTIKTPYGDFVTYFDIGSNTYLGNYGGDDHWFFDDTAGFYVEMDMESAVPFDPKNIEP